MSTPDNAMNLQKNVRKYIFEHFEEHATAPVLEQIMQEFGLDRASAFNVLVELQTARHHRATARYTENPHGISFLKHSDTLQGQSRGEGQGLLCELCLGRSGHSRSSGEGAVDRFLLSPLRGRHQDPSQRPEDGRSRVP